jgi:hypothetical protein
MTVQEKIQQLLWDRRYVQIPAEYAKPGYEYVIIKDMTTEDRNIHSFVRRRELESARKQGVPTEAELLAEAKKVGLWTSEDDLVMTKADEHIAFLEAEQKKQKFLARKKSLQVQIDAALEKKRLTQSKRNEYFIHSAEFYANEVAANVLVRRVVFDIEGRPLWPDDASFLHSKHNHINFLIYVTNEVLSEGILPIDEIREVARHPEWRLTWVLQRENLHTIFNRNIGDLSINQKLLIYWSRVYDSALESTDPPSLDIINDDDKFDEWLSNRELNDKESSNSKRLGAKDHNERMQLLDGEYSETCNCGAKAKNVGKGLGERVPHTTTCPWGTFRRYTPQEREQIANQTYARNSDRVRSLLEHEQQTVIEKGQVEEHHLRGTKTRHILGMKTDVVSTHKK